MGQWIDIEGSRARMYAFGSGDSVGTGEAGIVGMGRCGVSTQVKQLTVPAGKKVEHLIINGAGARTYLTSDHRVMPERSEEPARGRHDPDAGARRERRFD